MITTTANKIEYTGNGVTTVFSFPYLFYSASHLVVKLINTSTREETTQVITTNYTVSGEGNPAGGSVTMLVAPPSTHTLRIERVVPLTQLSDYIDTDRFPAETHEQALDLIVMMIQQLYTQLTSLQSRFLIGTEAILYQQLDVATTIPVTSSVIRWKPIGSMTALPNVQTSGIANGTILIIFNADVTSGTLHDHNTLSGSGLQLGAASRTLGPGDSIVLMFNTNRWYELAFNSAVEI